MTRKRQNYLYVMLDESEMDLLLRLVARTNESKRFVVVQALRALDERFFSGDKTRGSE